MTEARLLLVRFRWADAAAHMLDGRNAEVFRAVAGDAGYAYLPGVTSSAPWVERLVASLPGATHSPLLPLLAIPGASVGASAPYHYVVETDVSPEREADFNAWYDGEHMPGLAAVPGTVRARRFRSDGGHPRYHACYDLESAETLGSPPWLAVRGTAWSDRVRPAFRNTRRTMFRRVA